MKFPLFPGTIGKTPEAVNRAPMVSELERILIQSVVDTVDQSVEEGAFAVSRHGFMNHLPAIQKGVAGSAIKLTPESVNQVPAQIDSADAAFAYLGFPSSSDKVESKQPAAGLTDAGETQATPDNLDNIRELVAGAYTNNPGNNSGEETSDAPQAA